MDDWGLKGCSGLTISKVMAGCLACTIFFYSIQFAKVYCSARLALTLSRTEPFFPSNRLARYYLSLSPPPPPPPSPIPITSIMGSHKQVSTNRSTQVNGLLSSRHGCKISALLQINRTTILTKHIRRRWTKELMHATAVTMFQKLYN